MSTQHTVDWRAHFADLDRVIRGVVLRPTTIVG